MKYTRGSFITVPSREVLRGLHPTAQALYMWLCSYSNETGQCFPSRRTLAEDVGCSEDTIDKMLGILMETGLVKKRNRVENGEKLSNLYTVLVVGGSRQNRVPSPTESGTVAARIGINSIHLTKPTEERVPRVVIEVPDSEEPTRVPKEKDIQLDRAVAYWHRRCKEDYGREPSGGQIKTRKIIKDARKTLSYGQIKRRMDEWLDADEHEPHDMIQITKCLSPYQIDKFLAETV